MQEPMHTNTERKHGMLAVAMHSNQQSNSKQTQTVKHYAHLTTQHVNLTLPCQMLGLCLELNSWGQLRGPYQTHWGVGGRAFLHATATSLSLSLSLTHFPRYYSHSDHCRPWHRYREFECPDNHSLSHQYWDVTEGCFSCGCKRCMRCTHLLSGPQLIAFDTKCSTFWAYQKLVASAPQGL